MRLGRLLGDEGSGVGQICPMPRKNEIRFAANQEANPFLNHRMSIHNQHSRASNLGFPLPGHAHPHWSGRKNS
jgi:hypothetical protein